jgi:hypothetical protein
VHRAAQSTGATVLAVDMPGTGEIANLPLGAEADQVVLIPGTRHVAMSKMAEVMPMMLGWLRSQLQGPGSAT